MLAPPPLPRTLEAALRDVTSTKPASRQSAIIDLVRHASLSDDVRARALPLIEKALTDEWPPVRSAAAVALADLRASEAVQSLLKAVEDDNAHVRQMAINALGEIKDLRALPRLERALDDARPDVRYQAIIAFSRVVPEPAALEKALARALGDDDDAIRYIALRLAEDHKIAEGPVAARAKALLNDPSAAVKLAAAVFLARVGHDGEAKKVLIRAVREGLKGAEKEDEQAAIEVCGERGFTELTGDLERRVWGFGSYVRETYEWHAKIALAAMGHARATAEILGDLDSWRRETRQAAVVAVGRARLVAARERLEALRGRVDATLLDEALARLV